MNILNLLSFKSNRLIKINFDSNGLAYNADNIWFWIA